MSAPVDVLVEAVVFVIVVAGVVTVPVNVGEAKFAFKFNAVCWAVETGFAVSAVLSTLPRPTIVDVIPLTVPVNVGEAKFAFKFSAVCWAVETGFAVSAVLSTLPRPTIVDVIPTVVPPTHKLPLMPTPPATISAPVDVLVETVVFVIVVAGVVTVPVNVGEAKLAFKSNAVCWAVETGFAVSAVLSTLPRPTIDLDIPPTVPVNVGEAKLAFKSNAVC